MYIAKHFCIRNCLLQSFSNILVFTQLYLITLQQRERVFKDLSLLNNQICRAEQTQQTRNIKDKRKYKDCCVHAEGFTLFLLPVLKTFVSEIYVK